MEDDIDIEQESFLSDKRMLEIASANKTCYQLTNRVFLRLQRHFPPETVRHASCSLCPNTFNILLEEINAIRSTVYASNTKPCSTTYQQRSTIVTIGVYFYFHRLYLAFRQPSTPQPPLTRGDPYAPTAYMHQLTVLCMAQRINTERCKRDKLTGTCVGQGRRRRASVPAQPTHTLSTSRTRAKSQSPAREFNSTTVPDVDHPKSTPDCRFNQYQLLLENEYVIRQTKSIVLDLLKNCFEDRSHKSKYWSDPETQDMVRSISRLVVVIYALKEELEHGPNTTHPPHV